MTKNRRLGKGLEALFGDMEDSDLLDNEVTHNQVNEPEYKAAVQKNTENNLQVVSLSIDMVVPGKFQPREEFEEESLQDLSDSIKRKGVLSPIMVKFNPEINKYELIAGERRWRASRIAGLKEIPAIISAIEDKDAYEVALIENIQRKNLLPLEEAKAYKSLIERYSYTHEELAVMLGKSRSYISNMLRLTNVDDEAKEKLNNSKISKGHLKALMADIDSMNELLDEVIKNDLSVREVEQIIRQKKKGLQPKNQKQKFANAEKDDDLAAIERSVSEHLGLKVKIQDLAEDGGQITISFYSFSELDLILQKLTGGSV